MRWLLIVLLGCLIGCSPTHRQSKQNNQSQKTEVRESTAVSEADLPDLRREAHALAMELEQILKTQGTQAMSQYLRLRAVQGLKLSPLRELFYHKHGFSRQVIAVRIPPDGQAMIDFANQQLTESGVDFIQFKGIVDKNLPPLDHPAPSQEKLYKKWKFAKHTTLPLIGFAVTILEAGANAPMPQLVTSLARSFTVLALDLQFKIFRSRWTRVLSNRQGMLQWQLQTTSRKLQHLTKIANRLLDGTRGLASAYLYSYLVNWGYAILLYASRVVTLRFLSSKVHFLPLEPDEFSIVNMIQESWLVNTAYFLAFGLTQNTLRTSLERGEISETLRYQLNTVAVAWANFWRIVSFIPGMTRIGQIMLYSFGAIVTVPLVIKTYEANDFARETAHIFAANEGDLMTLSPTEQAFGDVYADIPFSRNESLSQLMAKLREQLATCTKVHF